MKKISYSDKIKDLSIDEKKDLLNNLEIEKSNKEYQTRTLSYNIRDNVAGKIVGGNTYTCWIYGCWFRNWYGN